MRSVCVLVASVFVGAASAQNPEIEAILDSIELASGELVVPDGPSEDTPYEDPHFDLIEEPDLPPPVVDRLLRLPPPQTIEGAHPIRPLPHSPGAIPGISTEQDLIHHGRRYVGFVATWNLSDIQLRMAPDADAWAAAANRLAPAAEATGLHELYWWQISPAPGPAPPLGELEIAVLSSPASDFLESIPDEDGWLLIVADIEHGTIHRVLTSARSPSGWGFVPILAVDLYHHAMVVDHPYDRAGHFMAVWSQIKPARLHRRFQWLAEMQGAWAEPTGGWQIMPSALTSEEIALRNEEHLSLARVTLRGATPEMSEEELLERWPEIVGPNLGTLDVIRWLAYAPDWAVLAWDPQSGTLLLTSVETLERGRAWGALPLLALPRRARPENIQDARSAFLRLPWRTLGERIEGLREAGAGADLP